MRARVGVLCAAHPSRRGAIAPLLRMRWCPGGDARPLMVRSAATPRVSGRCFASPGEPRGSASATTRASLGYLKVSWLFENRIERPAGTGPATVIASEAKQSRVPRRAFTWLLDCFASLAMTEVLRRCSRSLRPNPYSPLPIRPRATHSRIPSTVASARFIASSFAAAFSGTDCRFSPGSSKSWVAPW